MPTPNEIGTLRARPNGESLFVGSSSGVFFINTVRRAFSRAAATTNRRQPTTSDGLSNANFANLPSPEDCIIGPETQSSQDWLNARGEAAETTPTQHPHAFGCQGNIEDLGELPDHAVAKELLITYFRTWHPLLPFLHGPTCLSDLEDAYAAGQASKPKSLSTGIIFQCLFNIAKLDRPDLPSLGTSHIRSEEQLMLALSIVSLKCDLPSIQALLAAQLYFVTIMDVRAASSVGGLVLRSIFKSGMHRCPVRYTHLTTNDHDMRKRAFWSAYCLDRYVSQTLGHPLGIQDSDFDVCAPGTIDLHQPVRSVNEADEGTSPEETVLHLPANHPGRQHASPRHASQSPGNGHGEGSIEPDAQDQSAALPGRNVAETDHGSQQRRENQTAQAQFVRYSQLIGRMMETFHKSIHVRTASHQNILFLKADIDAWGNDLPQPALSPLLRNQEQPASLDRDVFFWVARQQLLLLVNRPSLSLDPASAEFRYAAQICIGAARSIIRTLESHMDAGGALFWPGSIHSVWMSGLVMAFTCQLKLHSTINAINDIIASLKVLRAMTQRWQMAQNCHEVLSMLLRNIQNPEIPGTVSAGVLPEGSRYARSIDTEHARGEKRPRESNILNGNSLDDHGFGNIQQRRRISPNSTQPSHASSTTPFRRHARMSMNSVNGLHDFDPCFDAQSGFFQNNNQFSSIDPLPLSHTGENSYGFSFHPNQVIQQYDASNPSLYTNSRNIVMNRSPVLTPGLRPSTFYDVFDGAAWGPLLDLVEDNG
ncbi:fungal-specific transcription factor domain-containing protein [Pyrenochaeta sp. MPI-SDFR-AT-0127]|nr:fungal-specific transcription factor domain-containing protein [Pyrenochaeta sp. MPI-SDFR-AT-0127]